MLYDKLNLEQYKCITSKNKFNVIIAGAGSGKTRVIMHRILWLIKKNKVSSRKICAITFTNKASSEMKTRVDNLLKNNNVYVGTFHSLGYRILQFYYKYCKHINRLQVIGNKEQSIILRNIIAKYEKKSGFKANQKNVQYFIDKIKGIGIRYQHVKASNAKKWHLNNIYGIYELFCDKNMLLDFNEIIIKAYEILCCNCRLRKIYRQVFPHLLVDEFQDTNNIQYNLLKILTVKIKSMFVVCDDDQLIYGWRGAQIKNIKRVVKDYNNVLVLYLKRNYRCRKDIILFANAFISNNINRFKKKLWTNKVNLNNIYLYRGSDELNESYYIVYELNKLKKLTDLKNICILYRSKSQVDTLKKILFKEKIPYYIHLRKMSSEYTELKEIFNYVNLIFDQRSNILLSSILDIKPVKDKNYILEFIKAVSQRLNVSYVESILKIYTNNMIDTLMKRHKRYIFHIIKILKQISVLKDRNIIVSRIFKYLIKNVNLIKYLKVSKQLNSREKFIAIKSFYFSIRQLLLDNLQITENLIKNISNYLSPLFELEKSILSGNSINLMTIHASKGLEFDYVFIMGMEEGIMPSINDIEEERRVFYVAITRTKKKLFLSFSNIRGINKYKKLQNASRFFAETPSNLIKKKRFKSIRRELTKVFDRSDVVHKILGIGKVVEIRKNGKNLNLFVVFKKYGCRVFDANSRYIRLLKT